jgi:hypothetical protein
MASPQRTASTALSNPTKKGADQPALILGYLRLNRIPYISSQPKVRALLIKAHQAAVAGNVGNQHGG